MEEAIASFEECLRLDPSCADTHKNLALALLLTGNFDKGWPEYEWRNRCERAGNRTWTQPLWEGGSLVGRTILLHAEQGLGDTLHFIRYASLVKERGGTVLVEVPSVLVPLLRRCSGIDRLIPAGSPLPSFDVQAPLLSLSGLFHTTLRTVPATVPYLTADPGLVERWRTELHRIFGIPNWYWLARQSQIPRGPKPLYSSTSL